MQAGLFVIFPDPGQTGQTDAFPLAGALAIGRRMRALTALLLSLVLAVASVSMAVARGQAPMGETVALCVDGNAVTVTLDANGNPVSAPPHLCPDCLGAVTAFDLPAALSLPVPFLREGNAEGSVFATLSARPSARAPSARGPPAFSV